MKARSWPGASVRSKVKSQVPDEAPRGKPLAERAGDIEHAVPVRGSAVGPWMEAAVVSPVKPSKSNCECRVIRPRARARSWCQLRK